MTSLKFDIDQMINGVEMQGLPLKRQIAMMKIIGERMRLAWKREGLEQRFCSMEVVLVKVQVQQTPLAQRLPVVR